MIKMMMLVVMMMRMILILTMFRVMVILKMIMINVMIKIVMAMMMMIVMMVMIMVMMMMMMMMITMMMLIMIVMMMMMIMIVMIMMMIMTMLIFTSTKVVSKYQDYFGQVQDLIFLPGGEEFISAAEVVRRNATDKGIMAWDFKSTAVLSNQIYQVCYNLVCFVLFADSWTQANLKT